MGIELKLTGMCEGCPGFELKTEKMFTWGHLDERAVEMVAYCSNRDLCRRIERHLLKYMTKHPYTGPDPLELDI